MKGENEMTPKRIIAIAISAGALLGLGSTPVAHAETKCPTWMCGSNGTLSSGLTVEGGGDGRVVSNGTRLSGLTLPSGGR